MKQLNDSGFGGYWYVVCLCTCYLYSSTSGIVPNNGSFFFDINFLRNSFFFDVKFRILGAEDYFESQEGLSKSSSLIV